MTDEPSSRFRVYLSRVLMEELEQIAEVAHAEGQKDEFLRWLKELDFRLTYEPHEWGKSCEIVPTLQLEIRFGTVGAITVWYGVNTETRTVYVK